MNKMIKKLLSCLLLWMFLMPLAQAEKHDQSAEVNIASTRVGEGLYMLTGQGGNIGLSVGKDGVFMIDDQFAPLTEK